MAVLHWWLDLQHGGGLCLYSRRSSGLNPGGSIHLLLCISHHGGQANGVGEDETGNINIMAWGLTDIAPPSPSMCLTIGWSPASVWCHSPTPPLQTPSLHFILRSTELSGGSSPCPPSFPVEKNAPSICPWICRCYSLFAEIALLYSHLGSCM